VCCMCVCVCMCVCIRAHEIFTLACVVRNRVRVHVCVRVSRNPFLVRGRKINVPVFRRRRFRSDARFLLKKKERSKRSRSYPRDCRRCDVTILTVSYSTHTRFSVIYKYNSSKCRHDARILDDHNDQCDECIGSGIWTAEQIRYSTSTDYY